MNRLALLFLATFLVAACGEKPAEKKGAPPILVTTTQVKVASLENTERTLGFLEAVMDPKIAAEVAGRVIAIEARGGQAVRKGQLLARIDPTDVGNQANADSAEAARLEALLAQQERLVARQTELVSKNFISRNALDDVTAQRDALKNQLTAARSRSAMSRDNIGKTRVLAPFDGVIETQVASVGDYVKVGDPLFRLISNRRLRANLPFPESTASRLKAGMAVRISSPLIPDAPITGVLEDIRPTVLEGSRAVEAIARFDNPGALKGGGSVDAIVITGRKEDTLLVPEQSVVLRPAGKVVYVVTGGKAQQRVVETGSKQGGQIELLKGLQGGETIALDGAGFLTDGAPVTVKEPTAGQAKPATPPGPAK
ncbi:MAG: secretion protein HlyD [Rhodocyclaceae bacterium]|nr:secretion protein HlyD [Rhodocyclaceae bacterium]